MPRSGWVLCALAFFINNAEVLGETSISSPEWEENVFGMLQASDDCDGKASISLLQTKAHPASKPLQDRPSYQGEAEEEAAVAALKTNPKLNSKLDENQKASQKMLAATGIGASEQGKAQYLDVKAMEEPQVEETLEDLRDEISSMIPDRAKKEMEDGKEEAEQFGSDSLHSAKSQVERFKIWARGVVDNALRRWRQEEVEAEAARAEKQDSEIRSAEEASREADKDQAKEEIKADVKYKAAKEEEKRVAEKRREEVNRKAAEKEKQRTEQKQQHEVNRKAAEKEKQRTEQKQQHEVNRKAAEKEKQRTEQKQQHEMNRKAAEKEKQRTEQKQQHEVNRKAAEKEKQRTEQKQGQKKADAAAVSKSSSSKIEADRSTEKRKTVAKGAVIGVSIVLGILCILYSMYRLTSN